MSVMFHYFYQVYKTIFCKRNSSIMY